MTRTRIEELAVFDGEPLFATPRPVGQLAMPRIEDFLPLLRQALDAPVGSEDDTIVGRLERRLAAFHRTRHAVTLANAILGTIMLLRIFAQGRRGEVIIPAFGFRGLPHLARWADQTPRFCDVDPLTHGLDPQSVAAVIGRHTTAILGVCNFDSPGDIDELCEVAAAHRVPVLFRSANALGSTYRGRRLGGFGRAEVYSLHAAKLLNGFEGGYVTTDDDDLAAMLRSQRDFGLDERLTPAHAAMAYLGLDGLADVIARNERRFVAYEAVVAPLSGLGLLPRADARKERLNYQMVVLEVGQEWPLTRDQTAALLRAEGAAIRPYCSPALHLAFDYPARTTPPHLPMAEALATHFLHLPVGERVSLDDIERIGGRLAFVARHGGAIAALMAARGIK
jgi:dTDP-4-amino-4,6-dideoxyglucose